MKNYGSMDDIILMQKFIVCCLGALQLLGVCLPFVIWSDIVVL